MVAKAEDKRVRRTKKAVREALLRLMQAKPVARVTAAELCREADVNRNTFYAHYSTPEDVLAEIEGEFLTGLVDMLESTYAEGGVTLAMCKEIDSNRERWRSMWHGHPELLSRALDVCCERTLAHWDDENNAGADEQALFLQFVTRGASGVVGAWLDDGCRMPPEQMSALIDRFVREGQRGVKR
jgi:AcrR family transcriptional regulator